MENSVTDNKYEINNSIKLKGTNNILRPDVMSQLLGTLQHDAIFVMLSLILEKN